MPLIVLTQAIPNHRKALMAIKDEDRERVMKSAQELSDMVAKIDKNLVVHLTVGHRRLAAAESGNIDLSKLRMDDENFRNQWADGDHFANGFSKDGDGFVNISWVESETRVATPG